MNTLANFPSLYLNVVNFFSKKPIQNKVVTRDLVMKPDSINNDLSKDKLLSTSQLLEHVDYFITKEMDINYSINYFQELYDDINLIYLSIKQHNDERKNIFLRAVSELAKNSFIIIIKLADQESINLKEAYLKLVDLALKGILLNDDAALDLEPIFELIQTNSLLKFKDNDFLLILNWVADNELLSNVKGGKTVLKFLLKMAEYPLQTQPKILLGFIPEKVLDNFAQIKELLEHQHNQVTKDSLQGIFIFHMGCLKNRLSHYNSYSSSLSIQALKSLAIYSKEQSIRRQNLLN